MLAFRISVGTYPCYIYISMQTDVVAVKTSPDKYPSFPSMSGKGTSQDGPTGLTGLALGPSRPNRLPAPVCPLSPAGSAKQFASLAVFCFSSLIGLSTPPTWNHSCPSFGLYLGGYLIDTGLVIASLSLCLSVSLSLSPLHLSFMWPTPWGLEGSRTRHETSPDLV